MASNLNSEFRDAGSRINNARSRINNAKSEINKTLDILQLRNR